MKPQTKEKTNSVPVKKTKPSKIRTLEDAIKILTGAAIPMNHKDRTQTWVWGRKQSKKVVEAGSFLDTNEGTKYTTVWLTEAEFEALKEKK